MAWRIVEFIIFYMVVKLFYYQLQNTVIMVKREYPRLTQAQLESMVLHPAAQGRTLALYCNGEFIWQNAMLDYTKWDERKPRARQLVANAIAGASVLEIGCGREGGFAKKFRSLGAIDYVGIDVCERYVAESQEQVPDERYVWAEPIQFLRSRQFPAIVSCMVIDLTYFGGSRYAAELAAQIAASTTPGGYTIHVGQMLEGEFREGLVRNGIELQFEDSMCIIGQKK